MCGFSARRLQEMVTPVPSVSVWPLVRVAVDPLELIVTEEIVPLTVPSDEATVLPIADFRLVDRWCC